jgi:hypothetical protein
MRVQIDQENIQIVFIKEHDTYKYGDIAGRDKLNTICRVFRVFPQESNRAFEVGVGRANLNEKDTYDKIKGKKIALGRALTGSPWTFLTSERRAIIWEKFKKQFNINQLEVNKDVVSIDSLEAMDENFKDITD